MATAFAWGFTAGRQVTSVMTQSSLPRTLAKPKSAPGEQRTSTAIYQIEDLSVWVNAMANKTSKKPANVAKKAAAKRVAVKTAKPRKTAPKSQSRKVAKPA